MYMMRTSSLWGQKNATLSDKSAAQEYGIPRDEILNAIRQGELQYREGSMHGYPWFRLLRVEVEQYVEQKYGSLYLKDRKSKKELSEINRELKKLNLRVAELEERKRELLGT